MKKLEVCCADIESVWAAKEGGAHRIELCEALELDGLTPSEELIEDRHWLEKIVSLLK